VSEPVPTTAPSGTGDRAVVVACVKWTALRPDVDPLEGTVDTDERRSGISESDRAALEVALQLGAARALPVVVLTVGPDDADAALRDALAAGASRAIRVRSAHERRSDEVAALLCGALRSSDLDARVVVCGDLSADRGSGSVPAFLAHELDAVQALGLIGLEVTDVGSLRALRRLDGGRRERLTVPVPAVLSVEGSLAELRRAPLAAVLRANDATIEVLEAPSAAASSDRRVRPWRPRPRVVPAPTGEHALDRIVALTGALVARNPPRTVELEPGAAAEVILDQLRVWGYLGDADAGDDLATDPLERTDEPPLLG
jgi:electron transfer flavoprotein beta subunit